MDKERFKRIIEICAEPKDVIDEVAKNHDNNLWWPKNVEDYRKRLLIAGLSTRISYNMIDTYKSVISKLDKYSYSELSNMEKEKIITIIKPLGLSNARYNYIKSMINFVDEYQDELLNFSNEELITLIAQKVKGASYKVAQCCTLYMKGYYCGIMPVDSGMKDIELPCMGFNYYKNDKGHEILRKELEDLVESVDFNEMIKKSKFDKFNIENKHHPTWLIHLILIYYKRLYCNKHKTKDCPLHREKLTKDMCYKEVIK
ncbi:MAG: hypothetical protein IJ217_03330 [Clostridia bacterium]|nr:hypothetical protein [Clostridia bacterium]